MTVSARGYDAVLLYQLGIVAKGEAKYLLLTARDTQFSELWGIPGQKVVDNSGLSPADQKVALQGYYLAEQLIRRFEDSAMYQEGYPISAITRRVLTRQNRRWHRNLLTWQSSS